MTKRFRALTAAVLAVAVAVSTAGVAAASPARLSQAVQRFSAAGVPGVAVRVDDGRGRPVELVRQARWTLADHRLSLGDEFRMASNTKTVTATILLQLVAEGRAGLDDPVERWLPGVVPNGSAITLRMLLNQTSGLFDFLNDAATFGLLTGQAPRPWPPSALLGVAFAHPPLFAPGVRWGYSNTNYILLGLVLEEVSGARYADLVRDRIIKPLRLKDTYLPTDAEFRGRHAVGYEPDAEHLAPLFPPGVPIGDGFAGPQHHQHVNTSAIDLSAAWAAGGLVSTAADWNRFLTALMSGRLLPAAQLAQLRTAVPQGGTTDDGYGLGVMQINTPCGTVWGHSGGFPGYRSHNYADATGRRTVNILATTTYALLAPEAAAAQRELVDAAVCRMFGKS
ncbi:serine hydrolase domain-containing protein [Actinosynnema sp. NPDC047251]|uniref:Alkaline D-peptidase n=1 Tax=Saccharothrix espanaensis (strain ATCC 51144 / DSM 44229 / JCM 9112 / NBRC 15066 / NRRL 15764) TaxID=1179773 RepID=K0KD79_SACES|nr:serine hydrolase domain-containing protein [Saccharothrix espanaensis]CCH35517.1 Alkaline D-peptidase [Saccharothrix espanaensis DSM 44229]